MANSIERTGKIFMGTSNKQFEESLLLDNAIKARKEEKDLEEAGKLLVAARQAKQEEVMSKLEHLEMVAIGPKVIILPYAENPYRKLVSEGGILMPESVSVIDPESGEKKSLEMGIVCAKVIEVGTDTKWLKEGDDIYYQKHTELPIPFFDQGYKVIAEQNVLTVINENLKERFNIE